MTDETPNTNDGEDLEVADVNDFLVTRGDGKQPDPVNQRIPGTEQAIPVIPLTNGEIEKWEETLGFGEGVDEGEVAEIFNAKLPQLEREVTADDITNGFAGFAVTPILQAIKNASGYQAMMGFREQQMGMATMLKDLDDDELDRLMTLAEKSEKLSGGTS